MHDSKVIHAMICYGGQFDHLLGRAAQMADSKNLRKIKASWPELWAHYTELAELHERAAETEAKLNRALQSKS